MNIQFRKKPSWSVFIVCLSCLLILMLGPLMAWHGTHPLQSLHERLLVVIGLLLASCLGIIASLKKNHHHQETIDRHVLSQCKKQYHQLLRSSWKKKYGVWLSFHKKPCTLVLGHAASGKSQLIQSMSAHARTVTQATPTPSSLHMPTWWQDNDKAWLELCADTSKAHTPATIKHLFRHLKRLRWLMPISHIIIAIDLKQLYQHNSRQQLQTISKINALLMLAQSTYQMTPTYIIFTKSDLINGFTDYYTHSATTAHMDILGIDLSNQDLARNNLQHRLNYLITQLHKHMFEKIHAERSLIKKQRIQDFPKQIDALTPTIISITKNVFQHSGMGCQGIYFSSNEQNEKTIDYLAKPIEQAFNHHHAEHPTPFPGNHIFFSCGMLQVLHHIQSHHLSKQSYRKTKIITACILFSAFGIMYIYHTPWSEIQGTQGPLFARNAGSVSMPLSANKRQSIAQSIQQHLETKLQHDIDQESIQAYSDLVTYLSLGGSLKQHGISPHGLQTIFNAQHTKALDSKQKKQLQAWLNDWHDDKRGITTNPKLIATTLEMLQQQSPTDMVYAQLISELTLPQMMTSSASSHHPYTSDDFNAIMQHAIPRAIRTYKQFNETFSLGILDKHKNLTQRLKNTYISTYQSHWKQYILEPMHRAPHNTADAIGMLTAIEDSHTGLISRLQQAVQETTNNPDPLFQQSIASQFRPYQSYLANQVGSSTIYLGQLKKQLMAIAQSPLPLKAAFDFSRGIAQQADSPNVITTILQHADDAPQPIAQWLDHATHNIWQYLLSDSKRYINNQWHHHIYQPYMRDIDGKFPFSPDTNIDVRPDDFTTFFSANGLMNTFFNQYLKPFAQQHGRYWQWKNIYDLSLDIPQNHLDTFIRSKLITEMFFQDHDQIANISFSLQPTQVPSDVSRILVQTGDAQRTYQNNQTPTAYFHWPTTPYTSSINVENQYHNLSGITRTGYWSLFHLLHEAKIYTNPHNNKLTLSYNLNGETITMALQPSTQIHPFIPNILSQLHAYQDL